MRNLKGIHHVAIICSDYQRSKRFYVDVLGLTVLAENFRENRQSRNNRQSFKLDLQLPDGSQIELFSFHDAPIRLSYPEAQGLRHLALAVDNIEQAVAELVEKGVQVEAIRVDEYTGKRFVFFADPDDLPIELYEV